MSETTMNLRFLTGILIATLLTTTALAGTYVGGGTFVAKTETFGTLLDHGGVVCQGTDGSGIGGGCLPFPSGPGIEPPPGFVQVYDGAAGTQVAFQVCIDNNGDGICGGPQTDQACRDQIFFSHDDEGRFFNPLGPLPVSRLRGCEGNGGHDGYVVLLCQGAHEVGGASHTHTLSQGWIGLAERGSGYGDFCGGGGGEVGLDGFVNASAKAYQVV